MHLRHIRSQTLHHFRSAGYERYAIHGQVYLWGTVIDHEFGYRDQFAYTKNFVLSPDALPFTLAEIWPRLQSLTLYGSDIFVLRNGEIRYLQFELIYGLSCDTEKPFVRLAEVSALCGAISWSCPPFLALEQLRL